MLSDAVMFPQAFIVKNDAGWLVSIYRYNAVLSYLELASVTQDPI